MAVNALDLLSESSVSQMTRIFGSILVKLEVHYYLGHAKCKHAGRVTNTAAEGLS